MTSAATPTEEPAPFARLVVDAVVSGKGYESGQALRAADAERLPGWVVRDLVLGVHGPLAEPAVRINGIDIDGDIDLSYREWRGHLDLRDCRINGVLRLDHAVIRGRVRLDGCTLTQLHAEYGHIDGALLMREARCAEGIYGLAMTVSGSFNLRDAECCAPPDKPNRCALELFRARLGDVFLTRAKLSGGIYANGATVDRNIRLQGAQVRSREAMGWETGPDSAAGAVNLVGLTLGGALYLSSKDPSRSDSGRIDGRIVLTRMSCTSLRISPIDLEHSSLAVDHFTYRRLLGVTPQRWLDALGRTDAPDSQPYAQLAAYCADIGRSDLQRASLIELQRRLTSVLPRWSRDRWRRRLWAWSVEYGYRPGRSVAWLLLAAMLCTAILLVGGDFLVQPATGSLPVTRGVDGMTDAIVIAMDNLLPFAGLGVAKQWSADPQGVAQTLWLVAFVALKFIAWGLAAVGLASVTGVMKRA